MDKEIIVKTLKNLGIIILSYFGIFILNNIRNILNVILKDNNNLTFISIPIIISLIIFLFYIFKVKKKNKYLNIILLLMLIFFNICNGILYSSKINTFFFMYIMLMIFSFRLFFKYENFSISLIMSFSIMILITTVLGMLGILKIVKYVLPAYALYNLLYIVHHNTRKELKRKLDIFINKELLIFSILFMIAIIGGIGRFVHIYDEYSHWAYDAKAVIYYNKLSTSKDIMSQTRGYAPIITCWHYLVAQYSSFSEQNLYIGLSIFISIFLMSVVSVDKKSNYSYLAILVAFASCFIFGGVYSFNNLYADLAFGVMFGATIIVYFKCKENNNYKNVLIAMLIMLTLIKPSGCTASFTVLFYIMIDQIFSEKRKLIKSIESFIKKYWKVIIGVILSFIIWNVYVKICNNINNVFYDADVRPWTLKTDLSQKTNWNYILTFLIKIFASLDDTLIYSSLNISTYQFLIIMLIFITSITLFKKESIIKIFNVIISYLVFFALTMISMFVMLSYYEASIIASFGRYLNCVHIAIIMSLIYYLLKNHEERSIKIIGIIFTCFILINCSFKQITYFITDINERKDTHQIYNERSDKFKEVKENTTDESRIFVIDQEDKDGIMAMWYARYYLFPRKVNSSSSAITWKILTEKNKDDLQDWGLNTKKFENILIKYKFDYLYLYTKDELFYEKTKDMYKFDNFKEYNLYKIQIVNEKIELVKAIK